MSVTGGGGGSAAAEHCMFTRSRPTSLKSNPILPPRSMCGGGGSGCTGRHPSPSSLALMRLLAVASCCSDRRVPAGGAEVVPGRPVQVVQGRSIDRDRAGSAPAADRYHCRSPVVAGSGQSRDSATTHHGVTRRDATHHGVTRHAKLHQARPCQALPCHATPSFTTASYATPSYVTPSYATPSFTIASYATPSFTIASYATARHATPFHAARPARLNWW